MFSTFPLFVQKFQNFGIFLSKCELCSSLVYKGYLLSLLRTVCLSYPKQKILKETGTWMISSVSILFLWQVVSLVVCTITLEILGILISLPLESCTAWFARATRWGLIFPGCVGSSESCMVAALESLEEEIATGGPFKSNLFAIAFTCHYLFFSISSNEIWKLCWIIFSLWPLFIECKRLNKTHGSYTIRGEPKADEYVKKHMLVKWLRTILMWNSLCVQHFNQLLSC